MKRAIYFLGFTLMLFSLTIHAQERKKVAVVLSGGGAKGVAHIGAIKVIEEAGIPIDYVVGTSMGSIIGGLYAIGYTSEQMDSLVRAQDWMYLLTDATDRREELLAKKQKSEQYALSIPFKKKPKDAIKGGIIQGRNLAKLFSELTEGYHDSIDFQKLPIPFACVSHNLVDGSEYVFYNGKLALAMRASMSIPGAFQPVHWNNMVLVDGGMSNNYPVDIAKKLGADIVIGVDVQEGLAPADKLNTLSEVLGQIINLMVENKYEENVANSDIHIKVNASDYSAASFTSEAIDTLLHRGEVAAREQFDSLILLKKKIGIPDQYIAKRHGPFIIPQKEKYNIVPEIDPGKKPANSINVGVRFDNESLAALIFNTNVYLNEKQTRDMSLTIRLGRESLGRLDYTVKPFNSKWNVNWAYQIDYNDLDLYNYGKKTCTYSFLHHLGQFNISRSWRSIRFSLGGRYEYFHFNDFLLPPGYTELTDVENEDFFVYYGQMQFDSYNRRTYPTSGMKWEVNAALHTDNLVKYNGRTAMPILSASWEAAIRLRNRLTLIPWVCGRAIIADDDYYTFPVVNVVGGNAAKRFLPQQMPFVGIDYMQITGSKTMIGGFKLRQRMGNNQYLTFTGNVGLQSDDWQDLFDNNMWGGGITYGYDTFIGPLEATFSYSNITKELGAYISLGYNF